MKKLILIAMAALMVSGCFLDDLCGIGGDDDRPAVSQPDPRGKVVRPNDGVYHNDCQSEGRC